MTRWVRRDGEGNIVGHFANRTPQYEEEELADDHPDILAWEEAGNAPSEPVASDTEALIAALIKQGTITQEKIDAEKGW